MVFIKRPPPLINISTSGEPRKGLSPTKQRDDDDDEEREDRSKWKTITLTELHTALKKGKRPWIIILNHPVYPDAIPTQLSLLCPRGGGGLPGCYVVVPVTLWEPISGNTTRLSNEHVFILERHMVSQENVEQKRRGGMNGAVCLQWARRPWTRIKVIPLGIRSSTISSS